MATLYIYKWNNYYNRRVMKDDPSTPLYAESVSLNFNPNDGVNTIYVAGRQGNVYEGGGDYVCYLDDNVNITSRWFIVEQKRTLKGQYQLTLHRDLLKDYYDKLLDADIFIEKAILPDSNPLIYNDEAITTNQIKSGETPLKDKTGCPWIVGYFQKNWTSGEVVAQGDTDYQDTISDTFENWLASAKKVNNFRRAELDVYVSNLKSITNFGITKYTNRVYYTTDYGRSSRVQSDILSETTSPQYGIYAGSQNTAIIEADQLQRVFRNNSAYVNVYNHYFSSSGDLDYIVSLNNKIVKFNTGTQDVYDFYKLKITLKSNREYKKEMTYDSIKASGLKDLIENNFSGYYVNNGYTTITATIVVDDLEISYEKLSGGKYTGTLNTGTSVKKLCGDTPYGIFAIPYGEMSINGITTQKDVGFNWAQKLMAEKWGTSSNTYIYDLQLLPFCPMPEKVDENGAINFTDGESLLYDTISDVDTKSILSYIIYPQSQSFTLNILDIVKELNNVKIESQCDMYRLCSPNFNGQFEFNAAKNNGIYAFNIDCTYKPYNPYIHINPDFQKLYGTDYNDARGLICQGDFSLPVMNNAWISYQNSNKNYENIFNRQVENMETNRKYQRAQEKVSAIAGTVSGAVSAAKAGSQLGGVVGAAIGGVVGGIASAAGGIADIAISDKLYNESLDYTKDLYTFNLDNIKAQPQSVGKTTAFTYNNKIFPILEYYTCTSEEKEAVANKIIFNSMTVGAIGKLRDYINNVWYYGDKKSKGYFKGRLISIELDEGDFTIQKAIAEEIYKGAFYTWD